MAIRTFGERWLGRTLDDRYHVLRRLGSGGMGVVYVAEHLRLGRMVAIKIVNTRKDPRALQRLAREARAVSLIGHDHIVEALDFGETPDLNAYMVMELLDGETLEQRIDRCGPLDLATTCHLLIQAAYALEAAHDSGIIHRDVKPANIFVCNNRGRSDFVKVLDFGIVALSPGQTIEPSGNELTDDAVVGTPAYIAPEQLRRGHLVDARADVFALGVTMYEMLCGRRPFDAKDPIETVIKILREEPIPLSQRVGSLPLARQTEQLLRHALQKDPARRLASMRLFRGELVKLRRGLSAPTRRKEERFESREWPVCRTFTTWVSSAGVSSAGVSTGAPMVIEFSGVLDEKAGLATTLERVSGAALHIKLGRVTRINSAGYREWINWLDVLHAQKKELELHEVPVPMVRQANMDPSFLRGVPVRSFYAPFFCEHCSYETVVLLRISDITASSDAEALRTRPCEACGESRLAFADVAETFLLFLRRQLVEPEQLDLGGLAG